LHALRDACATTAAIVSDNSSPPRRLIGTWENDASFLIRLQAPPGHLERAARADWSAAIPVLAPAYRAIIVGRDRGLAVAEAFDVLIPALGEERGWHLDAPPNLTKVRRTV
jgi:hypothetical protein